MTTNALIVVSCLFVSFFSAVAGKEGPGPAARTDLRTKELVRIISAVSAQMDSSRFDSAQVMLNKGFRLVQREPYPAMEFYLLAYQSEVFYYNAMVEQGIQFALRGIKVAGQLNDSTMLANQHNLLGLLYSDLDQLTKAIQHLKRGLALLPATPRSRFELTERYQILSNLGQCYDQIGQYDRAITVNQQSFAHASLKGSARGKAIAAWALGNDFAALKNTQEAMVWYNRGLAAALNGREFDVAIMIYLAQCKLFIASDPASALTFLDRGIALMASRQNQVSTYTRRAFAKGQTEIYYQLKNYKRAVDTHRLLKQIDDDIQDAEKKQRLAMLQAFYDNERRILRYQERERFHRKEIAYNRQLVLATAIFAGLLLISLVAVLYGYRQKQKVKDLLQLQKIQTLTQEHEMANLKAMITGEEQERVRIARELHDGLGGILAAARFRVEAFAHRFVAETEEPPVALLDEASKEVRRISQKLMPYLLQYYGLTGALREYVSQLQTGAGPSLHIAIQGETPEMNAITELGIYRCVQEMIGNAIRYAGATHINIAVSAQPEKLTIRIDDDGKGFDVEEALASRGNGLKNCRKRIADLGGTFSVQSVIGRGTTISLELTYCNSKHFA